MAKQVRIHLGKDGSVRAEAVGFKGPECEEKTSFLDKLFGKPERKLKDSYYEQPEAIADGLPEGHCG